MRHRLVLGSTLAALALLAAAPSTQAYGSVEQWQIGFSGTCSNTSHCGPAPGVPGAFGFWGWCAFGGSNGSADPGTIGTTADCQLTTYARGATGPNNPVHVAFDVSKWQILTGSPMVPPGVGDFQFISGSYEVTGPGASLFGVPTGVPIPLPPNCNVAAPMLCDTGLPAVPGHFSFHPFPGFEINIQVSKLP